jgi:hypothetical protein
METSILPNGPLLALPFSVADTEARTDAEAGRDRELETLRARVAELEAELFEQAARTNAAVARAQDRAYWLDRYQIDLNALMRRRGAAELRFAVKVARRLARGLRTAWARVRS